MKLGLSTVNSVLALMLVSHMGEAQDVTRLQVTGGKVKFDAITNILALTVHGQSVGMAATLTLRKESGHVELENVEAKVDPKTFTTGISLRDQHLRRKVFAIDDQTMPELQFVTEKVMCPDLPPGQDIMCSVSGQLSLRGVARPFAINLKIRNDGKGYRVSGAGALKLSMYKVEPPCNLGVCVTDDVKLNLEFDVRASIVLRTGGLR